MEIFGKAVFLIRFVDGYICHHFQKHLACGDIQKKKQWKCRVILNILLKWSNRSLDNCCIILTHGFVNIVNHRSKQETVATFIQNGNVTIPLLPSVTNLGAKIDNRCDIEKHALKICTNACFHLQSIRKIRRCLTMESWKILVHSLVTNRLNYANILLCNASDRVTARLERVQRSAAKLIYGIHHYQRVSITAVLHELHWLPVVIRFQYRVRVTVFKAHHSGTPQYLADLIKKHTPVRILRSSHNLNLLENLNIPEKSLDPSLSVL